MVWPVVAPRIVSNVAAVFVRFGGRGGGVTADELRFRLSMLGFEAECCKVRVFGLTLREDGVARRRGGGGGGACLLEFAAEPEFDDEEWLLGVVEPG